MSPLLRKEIRLLLPSFGVALLLTFSVWLIPPNQNTASGLRLLLAVFPLLFCPAALVAMALDSFGREIGSKTFANLLSQPVSRPRIWRTKTVLLAVALAVIFGSWWLQFSLHAPFESYVAKRNLHEATIRSALVVLTTFSGGLWTVLLFRQVAAAFWFTLLVPASLAMLTMHLTEKFSESDYTERNIVIVLLLYSLTGFLWARRMFLRAQDVQWTGGTIALPGWLKLPRRFGPTRIVQGRHPRLALLGKEFQLHQSQFLIAGALALLHLGMIAARKASGGFKNSYILEFLTFQFWILWAVIPLLIGCAAVAEERKLGTLEAQLCLPARRRTQFLTKAGVALVLAIIFGVFVPVLFEGRRILPDFHANLETALNKQYVFMPQGMFALTLVEIVNRLDPLLPFLPLLLLVVGFVTMAFYASTLVRNTLQAMAPAILGVVSVWALLACVRPSFIQEVFGYSPWRGGLIYLIGVPALIVTIGSLTYWNFKRVLVGWPVWRRNLLILFSSLTLVVTVTTAIYHRVWEYVAAEPAHGPSRLNRSQVVGLRGEGRDITVQFADGRVWLTPFTVSASGWTAMLLGNWRMVEMFGGGHFMAGTNWMTLAHSWRDVIGLQRDGSLWVSEQPENPWKAWRRDQPRNPEAIKLVRFGNDYDWKCLAARWAEAYLLKNDGTLWRVGTNHFDWKKKWPGLRAFPPQRVGADADWAEIETANDRMIFRKRDGRAYVYETTVSPSGGRTPADSIKLDESVVVGRSQYLEEHRWRSLAWATTPQRWESFLVGVDTDGKFYLVEGYRVKSRSKPLQAELARQNIQLGRETGWVAAAGNGHTVITLKADGSLWTWDFPDDLFIKPEAVAAKRLGTHSDWQAIVGAAGGVVSLAADGSLWFWHLESRGYYDEFQPLLAQTRKPQRITNIFGKSD